MKILLIVPFLGIVLAAPVTNEEETLRPIVKRAMETIMFGNQQNAAKQVKKSDPSVPLRDTLPDVKGPVLPDNGGEVQASKAEDISEAKSEEIQETNPEVDSKQDEETVGSEEKPNESTEESAENTENDATKEAQIGTEEEKEIRPEDAAAIEELEKTIGVGDRTESGNTDIQSTNNEVGYSPDSNYGRPYDIVDLYNMLQYQYPRTSMNYLDLLSRRRRAIQKRRFMGNFKERAVKRAHRTKRDLTYPDESELYEPYFYPDLPYGDSDLYGGYESPYETEELSQNQMDPIEDILAENGEYNLPYSADPYDDLMLYGYRPYGYGGVDEDYVPVKRQSMLSFVPGNRKRSSYFYPVNEEPQTHFGAFVPEKRDRDYFETYGSLVRAARLLAAREEEREALQGMPEWY